MQGNELVVNVVPEPATLALLIAAAGGLAVGRRHKSKPCFAWLRLTPTRSVSEVAKSLPRYRFGLVWIMLISP